MPHATYRRTGVRTTFAAALLVATSGCSEFEIQNEPPVAVARVLVNGTPLPEGDPIPYAGQPVTVTLDASESRDEDGEIAKYLWLRTDVSPVERFAGNGRVDAGGLPPFTGDPPAGVNPQVTLDEGTHRFSLWVTDNEDMTSEPDTIEVTIETPTNYMPDPACMEGYPNPNPDCAECVCSPMANSGCLEAYTACFGNADAMFVMLCSAVVNCAVTAGCSGAACYTGGCMAQIDAAATYMGGTLADCSAGDPATNPCAAATQLGACSATGACMAACD